jgi:hypothetical protein
VVSNLFQATCQCRYHFRSKQFQGELSQIFYIAHDDVGSRRHRLVDGRSCQLPAE